MNGKSFVRRVRRCVPSIFPRTWDWINTVSQVVDSFSRQVSSCFSRPFCCSVKLNNNARTLVKSRAVPFRGFAIIKADLGYARITGCFSRWSSSHAHFWSSSVYTRAFHVCEGRRAISGLVNRRFGDFHDVSFPRKWRNRHYQVVTASRQRININIRRSLTAHGLIACQYLLRHVCILHISRAQLFAHV